MFLIGERDDVEFDEFEGSGKCLKQFLKAFYLFTVTWKILFLCFDVRAAVKLSENNRIISRNDIEKILRINFYKELSECRELLQLDDYLNGVFYMPLSTNF